MHNVDILVSVIARLNIVFSPIVPKENRKYLLSNILRFDKAVKGARILFKIIRPISVIPLHL